MTDPEQQKKKELNANIKLDILGLKELAAGTKNIAEDTSEGLTRFLGSICMPVAEQFGGLLSDQVKYWRHQNFVRYSAKTKLLYEKHQNDPNGQVHPRVMLEIVDGVVKQESDDLLEWWAGLTIAACEEAPTDEDLVFIDKMNRLTRLQANVLEFLCTNANVQHTSRGLLVADSMQLTDTKIFSISGETDVDKLDREMDSLNSYGLVIGGFDTHRNDLVADIAPSSLGLQFYARCKGVKTDLVGFYSSKEMTECPRCGRIHR